MMDDLLADFLTETNENLAELDVALLALERAAGRCRDPVADLSHGCTQLKAPVAFWVCRGWRSWPTRRKTCSVRLRDGTMSASPDIVSQILAALDRIKAILAGLSQSGAEPSGGDEDLITALNATASGEAQAIGQKPASAPPPEPAPSAVAPEPAPKAAKPAKKAVAREPAPVPEPVAAVPDEPEAHPISGGSGRRSGGCGRGWSGGRGGTNHPRHRRRS